MGEIVDEAKSNFTVGNLKRCLKNRNNDTILKTMHNTLSLFPYFLLDSGFDQVFSLKNQKPGFLKTYKP